eukprot:COSAG05_NODE_4139_length_1655_cov_2.605398_1_plen_55_part_00
MYGDRYFITNAEATAGACDTNVMGGWGAQVPGPPDRWGRGARRRAEKPQVSPLC